MADESEKMKIRGTLYDATRMLLLAAVGAASLAQEELTTFVDKLVDRGEMAEIDARKYVKEIVDRREKMESERKNEEKKTAAASATKADIEALTARIADLTKQIEALKKGSEK